MQPATRLCSASTYADNVALPAFARRPALSPAAAAIGRFLLPAGPTAANAQQRRAAGEWDKQTDGRTDARQLHRLCATYAGPERVDKLKTRVLRLTFSSTAHSLPRFLDTVDNSFSSTAVTFPLYVATVGRCKRSLLSTLFTRYKVCLSYRTSLCSACYVSRTRGIARICCCAPCCCGASPAAIDRHLLTAGPTAANPTHAAAAHE